MPRTVRDAQLETRAARHRLSPRGEPYYRAIEEGLHLGYRKPKAGTGKWLARFYWRGRYQYEPLGPADDLSDGDGVAILSYRQAQALARERLVSRAQTSGNRGPLTVASALDSYLKTLSPRAAADARYKRRLMADLEKREVASLTADEIRVWHRGLAAQGARLRTRSDNDQKFRDAPNNDEDHRRRQASANRVLTVLKAALNRAFHDGKVASDAAWRQAKPFKAVEKARDRFLTVAEAKRLINGANVEFRPIVQAALLTGARYGELCRLTVLDWNPDTGSLAIRRTKTGKPRHVELTEEGVSFFEALTCGRTGDALIFTKADGSAWGASHQRRRMAEACEHGKISPPITFHGLRHTWASLSIMTGMPLLVAAQNLGHADGRMVERTYGHLSRDYLRKAIREYSPKFLIASGDNIKPLRGRP
jgi:integrase